MPLISVETYSDPEELESAHAVTDVELTPTAAGVFEAKVVGVALDQLWMHGVYESAPRIKHARQTPDRAYVKFLTVANSELVVEELQLPCDAIIRHPQAHSYFERTTNEVHWATMSLSPEHLTNVGVAVADCDLSPPRNLSAVVPPADCLGRLRNLHGAVTTLAEHAPQVLAIPGVAHGLEQSLLDALVSCIAAPEIKRASWASLCHATVMRRFHRLLEQNADRPMYVPEICAAIRAPERSLRLCCHEHLGMSPKQFLLLRRLNLAQRALRLADPTKVTVTDIATRYGFWHFGRFAGQYRNNFGESPSASLNREPN
jgi:AraC-like DNA-binding protein